MNFESNHKPVQDGDYTRCTECGNVVLEKDTLDIIPCEREELGIKNQSTGTVHALDDENEVVCGVQCDGEFGIYREDELCGNCETLT